MSDHRTIYTDPDFRRQPKTDVYCHLCQRDLNPDKPCRAVLIDWDTDTCGLEAVHPDDAAMVPGATWHRVGSDCAARVGAEWFADWSEVVGDAECAGGSDV